MLEMRNLFVVGFLKSLHIPCYVEEVVEALTQPQTNPCLDYADGFCNTQNPEKKGN